MKQQSAAAIKGWKKHILQQQIPRRGTEIRRTYDLFCANKGKVVRFTRNPTNPNIVNQLRDVYGLDIIRLQNRKWCLVGEWFGKVYIDYVAEKVNK